MRTAVIDIGTNSTRLLVADVVDGRIEELFRRSIVTRLGDRVDQTGRLDDAACERVYEVLARYRDEFSEAGATRVGGVATSAVRDSENGDAFVATIAERFGINIELIDGETEAQLTFAGASIEATVGEGGRGLVIDIGGGSTEFIVGHAGTLDFHVSTDVGAVRQSERFLHSDPPSSEELAALVAEVTQIIRDEVPEQWRRDIRHATGVAGTPTVLASIDLALEQFDPWKVHGHPITRAACEHLLDRLAALPLAERRNVTGLHPDRAPTIVAGAAIMLVALREFALDAIEVSEHDILYGLAIRLAAR
ncbi:MAG: Ppx/GppA phosphatase family protein [Solirubrobacterales bacterium]